MKTELSKLFTEKGITLTPLRKDILSIMLSNKKPMGAYDILNKLKKKRPNAEPPTVYRVLDFLIGIQLIHRIEAQNTYVCCTHLADDKAIHKAILLLCNHCHKSYEFTDKYVFDAITKFAKTNNVGVDDALIEMKGVCQQCA